MSTRSAPGGGRAIIDRVTLRLPSGVGVLPSQLLRDAVTVLGVGIGVAGLALTAWGIASLGPSLTPFPRPAEGAIFRDEGAYRLARHPIYGGFLLVAAGWSLVRSPLALIATVSLTVVLELKSRHEESMLVAEYPEYRTYRERVRWRFVPGLR